MNRIKSDFGDIWKRIVSHFSDFPYIWILIGALFLTAIISYFWDVSWKIAVWIGGGSLSLITLLLLIKPMNAVYGLIGTSGSIRLFFFNFLFITLLFAGVYHLAFFKNAGITFDVNQPHVDFCLYENDNPDTKRIIEKRDTVILEHQLDSVSFSETVIHITKDTIHYQRIGFWQVWRSTILTTLTQEATDLLNVATIHNSSMECIDPVKNKQKSDLLEWILIFHILIAWIFFGVFISLLYNKFRHES